MYLKKRSAGSPALTCPLKVLYSLLESNTFNGNTILTFVRQQLVRELNHGGSRLRKKHYIISFPTTLPSSIAKMPQVEERSRFEIHEAKPTMYVGSDRLGAHNVSFKSS